MKIGLVQTSAHLGNITKNLESHLEWIEKARGEKVDLLVFPELSLTGYSLMDMVAETAINPADDPVMNKLKEASRGLDIVCGFVEEKNRGLFYNSAIYLSQGNIRHIHRKVFLPTYGMFEEGKFFAQGKTFRTFPTPLARIGMMICYDFLHYGACYLLFAGGADIIIAISAAPGRGFAEEDRFKSSEMWELMGAAISRFSTCFVVYCNRTGIEDGKSFAGGSFIYGPTGKCLAKAKYLEEDFLIHDIDLEELRKARKGRLYRRDNKPEVILESLRRIIENNED